MEYPEAHTYLLKPGLWDLKGDYYDRLVQRQLQEGQLVVSHSPDVWVLEGQTRILTEQPQNVANRYEVTPLAQGATHTEWRSEVGGPEPIYGLCVLVADAIMMPWQSKSGLYWGQEVLIQVSPVEYRGRGFAFLKEERVAGWATRLIRTGP